MNGIYLSLYIRAQTLNTLLPIKKMRGALAPTFSAVKEKVDKLMTVPLFLQGPISLSED